MALWEFLLWGAFGGEFHREFRTTAAELGVRRDQLPARSPNLNAFVERFQGACLHQHYRTEFRYCFSEHVDDVDADLQAWLRHHNYRTATPRLPHPRTRPGRDLLPRPARPAHRKGKQPR